MFERLRPPFVAQGILIGLMGLAGCAAPPVVEPEPQVASPKSFRAQGRADALLSEELPTGTWWTALGDSQLDGLIAASLAHNKDLRAGMARAEQARFLAAWDQASLRPTLGIGLQAGRSHASDNVDLGVKVSSTTAGAAQLSVSTPSQSTRWQLPMEASYEPDLWGRLALTAQASAHRQQASEHDIDLARHSLVASVVSSYHLLGVHRAQLDLLKQISLNDERRINAHVARQETGLADGNALAAMRMQWANTKIRLQQIEEQMDLNMHVLALLCGWDMEHMPPLQPEMTEPAKQLDRLPILADLPARVLQRRPDVRSSQSLLNASLSELGAAQAEFLPTLKLTGSTGLESSALSQLLSSGSLMGSLAVQISVPLFDGGRRDAHFNTAKARLTEATRRHESTVLQALREVEDALVSASTRRSQVRLQELATEAAEQMATQAIHRSHVGRSSTLQAIDSQQAALQQRLSLLDAQRQAFLAQVSLLKVLAYP